MLAHLFLVLFLFATWVWSCSGLLLKMTPFVVVWCAFIHERIHPPPPTTHTRTLKYITTPAAIATTSNTTWNISFDTSNLSSPSVPPPSSACTLRMDKIERLAQAFKRMFLCYYILNWKLRRQCAPTQLTSLPSSIAHCGVEAQTVGRGHQQQLRMCSACCREVFYSCFRVRPVCPFDVCLKVSSPSDCRLSVFLISLRAAQ